MTSLESDSIETFFHKGIELGIDLHSLEFYEGNKEKYRKLLIRAFDILSHYEDKIDDYFFVGIARLTTSVIGIENSLPIFSYVGCRPKI